MKKSLGKKEKIISGYLRLFKNTFFSQRYFFVKYNINMLLNSFMNKIKVNYYTKQKILKETLIMD